MKFGLHLSHLLAVVTVWLVLASQIATTAGVRTLTQEPAFGTSDPIPLLDPLTGGTGTDMPPADQGGTRPALPAFGIGSDPVQLVAPVTELPTSLTGATTTAPGAAEQSLPVQAEGSATEVITGPDQQPTVTPPVSEATVVPVMTPQPTVTPPVPEQLTGDSPAGDIGTSSAKSDPVDVPLDIPVDMGPAPEAVAEPYSQGADGNEIVVGGGFGWKIRVNYVDIQAKVGNILFFAYQFPLLHTVWKMQANDCNFVGAVQLANTEDSPFRFVLTEPGVHYFACSIPGHCESGMKVVVNVVP